MKLRKGLCWLLVLCMLINMASMEVLATGIQTGPENKTQLSGTENSSQMTSETNLESNVNGTGTTDTVNTVKYSITVTGATASVTEASEGSTVKLTKSIPDGKVFDKWEVSEGVSILEDSFVMPKSNVTITAVYKNAGETGQGGNSKENQNPDSPNGDTIVKEYTITVTDGTANIENTNVDKAKAGAIVSLIAKEAEAGKVFDKWEVVKGHITITGNSFEMPEEEVELKAIFKNIEQTNTKNVSYMNGNDSITVDAIPLTTQTEWESGFYIVEGTQTIAADVKISGEVNLILADGAKLTVNSINETASENSNQLILWGQNEKSGSLELTNGDSKLNNCTINGGTVTNSADLYLPTLEKYQQLKENLNGSGRIFLETVYYLDPTAGNQTKTVSAELLFQDKDYDLNGGWYVVEGRHSFGRIHIDGNVDLILADGCHIENKSSGCYFHLADNNNNPEDGSPNSLTIWAQPKEKGMGVLIANQYTITYMKPGPAIGGAEGEGCGTLTVNGGKIFAGGLGKLAGAAIGGGLNGGNGGTVTINDGIVYALDLRFFDTLNSNGGAGIGGGSARSDCDTRSGFVTLNGGQLIAASPTGRGIGSSFFNQEQENSQKKQKGYMAENFTYNGGSFLQVDQDFITVRGKFSLNDEILAVLKKWNNTQTWLSEGKNFNVKKDMLFMIPEGAEFIIPEGYTLNNSGLILNNGTISGNVVNTENGKCIEGITTTYQDINGIEQKVKAIELTEELLNFFARDKEGYIFPEGWFVTKGNLSLNPTVILDGNVNLILADQSSLYFKNGLNLMSFSYGIVGQKRIGICDFRIWGQKKNSGKLLVENFIPEKVNNSTLISHIRLFQNGGNFIISSHMKAKGTETLELKGRALFQSNAHVYFFYGIKVDGGILIDEELSKIDVSSGIILQKEDSITSNSISSNVKGTVTLRDDITIPEGYTLTVPGDSSLNISQGVTLTNHGKLQAKGAITGEGKLEGNGSFQLLVDDLKDFVIPSLTYNGTDQRNQVTLEKVICGQKFTVADWNPGEIKCNGVPVKEVKEAGEYSVTYSKADGTAIDLPFIMKRADSSLGTLLTNGLGNNKNEYTYGDKIELTFTPKSNLSSHESNSLVTSLELASKQLQQKEQVELCQAALYYKDQLLAVQNQVTENQKVTLSYDTAEGKIPAEEFSKNGTELTIRWGGTKNINSVEQTVTVNLKQKEVVMENCEIQNKVYDATTTAYFVQKPSLKGLLKNDEGKVILSSDTAQFETKNIGTKIPVSFEQLKIVNAGKEERAAYYQLKKPADTSANITVRDITIRGIVAEDRIYNGEKTVVVKNGSVNPQGKDQLTVDLTAVTAEMKDSHAGKNKEVTLMGVKLTGADAKNYHLTGWNQVSVNIEAKELTVQDADIAIGSYEKSYDGKEKKPVVISVKDGEISIPVTEYQVQYRDHVNAGTGKVVIVDQAGGDYHVHGEKSFSIEKAQASVSAVPMAKELIYNGLEQFLVSAGKAQGGILEYSLEQDTAYSAKIPTAKDVKQYCVYYKVVGDENHNDSEVQKIDLEIAKKTVTITANNQDISYAEQPKIKTGMEMVSINGLAASDKLTEVHLSADPDFTTVSVSDAKIKKGDTDTTGNYQIHYQSGHLTRVHEWKETEYCWEQKDGKWICHASRTDQNNASIKESTEATVSAKKSKDPTCEEKGETSYIASFSVDWASNQTKTVSDLAAIGHNWSEPVIHFAEDGKTATAVVTCQNDGSHTKNLDGVSISAEITTAATCTKKGITTYTAKVSFNGNEYVATTTRQDVPTIAHKFSEWQQDENRHWHVCTVCQQIFDSKEHQYGEWDIIKNPTVDEAGKKKHICSVCQHEEFIEIPKKEILPTPNIPTENSDTAFRLESEEGISTVPDAIKKNQELNSPEKIETKMKVVLKDPNEEIPDTQKKVVDVDLMISTNDGKSWEKAEQKSFPKTGLTVTIPYPEGTGKDSHDFIVAHMFTQNNGEGKNAGDIEYPVVTKTEYGLQFTVSGLSPISVGWKEAPKPVVPDANDSNNSNDNVTNEAGNDADSTPTVVPAFDGASVRIATAKLADGSSYEAKVSVEPKKPVTKTDESKESNTEEIESEEETAEETTTETKEMESEDLEVTEANPVEKGNASWMWILLVAVIAAAGGFYFWKKKQKEE